MRTIFKAKGKNCWYQKLRAILFSLKQLKPLAFGRHFFRADVKDQVHTCVQVVEGNFPPAMKQGCYFVNHPTNCKWCLL